MASFPRWWVDGVEVMRTSGAKGRLRADESGWVVHFDQGEPDFTPNPSNYLEINASLGITTQQLRRICYDLERAILVAAGRGGGTHDWSTLPESKTAQPGPVHPKPLGVDQLSDVRRDCVQAVKTALAPYLV